MLVNPRFPAFLLLSAASLALFLMVELSWISSLPVAELAARSQRSAAAVMDSREQKRSLASDEIPVAIDPDSILGEFLKALGGSFHYSEDLFQQEISKTGLFKPYTTVLVPHGRALEREVTDYKHPRTIIAIQSTDPRLSRPMFLARTSGNEQLQILVPNNQATGLGRANDFFVVDHFGPGQTPVLRQPSRGLCTACHQGGLPIYGTDPWSETQNDFYQRLVRQHSGPGNLDPFIRREGYEVTPFRLLPDVKSVQAFYRIVESAAAQSTWQTLCANACADSVECRQILLKARVFNRLSPEDLARVQDELNKRRANPVPGPLPDAEHFISFKLENRLAATGQERTFRFAKSYDPLFPRKLSHVPQGVGLDQLLIKASRTCIDLDTETQQRWTQAGPEQLQEQETLREYLRLNWPPSAAALKVLSKDETPKEPKEPLQSPGPFTAVNDERALLDQPSRPSLTDPEAIYNRYCATCHFDGDAPTFYFGDMLSYVGTANSGRTALQLVEKNIMPPPDFALLRPEEREVLLNYLRGHSKERRKKEVWE